MASYALTDDTPFIPGHSTVLHTHVKTEAVASPDLLTPTISSLHQFNFKFSPPSTSSPHGSFSSSRHPSETPGLPPSHLYHFGSRIPSYGQLPRSSWPPSPTSKQIPSSMLNGGSKYDFGTSHHSIPYSEEYDDVSELVELGPGAHASLIGSDSSAAQGKQVRRRSSKACDQCRKSKCKCERSFPGESCKSCILLGTACTFLGPSRKRGPPKGYIDAIEARLHQTEALLGIIIAASDTRAQTLLRDIGQDPLAKEIINRVDNSPYGVKGRKRNGPESKPRAGHQASSSESSPSETPEEPKLDLTSTHPSLEWQDSVSAMLQGLSTAGANSPNAHESSTKPRPTSRSSAPSLGSGSRPILHVDLTDSCPTSASATEEGSPNPRRLRRRVDHGPPMEMEEDPAARPNSSIGSVQSHLRTSSSVQSLRLSPVTPQGIIPSKWCASPQDHIDPDSEGDDDLRGAVGQLSLNEDAQVRYHGKASGLHLLSGEERADARNAGGIWRFPKARVWPRLPTANASTMDREDEHRRFLPPVAVQDHLLDLYFKHVHPVFPVIHKRAFFEALKGQNHQPSTDTGSLSPLGRQGQYIPALLLLAMFSIAARYSEDPGSPRPSDSSLMWEAGDQYLDHAKAILDDSYAASRPSTCQTLLLMGYREIGIGAMALAWTYIGMAIRMAQDLGMHRRADGWSREGLGGRLFGDWELHERKRIWYACVIMDRYVSTYIGRPLMIFERDFDTLMPNQDDPEEVEERILQDQDTITPTQFGRSISCFNASAELSIILGRIILSIYSVRPVTSRYAESQSLETMLDKWYIELPEHLRFDPGSNKRPIPSPHVLTLHMQHWCVVLLLHRPFIKQVLSAPKSKSSEETEEADVRSISERSAELANGAANHITSIAATYAQTYDLKRSAVFLCYYIFTASVMHVTNLMARPNDPQARLGLTKCMEILRSMEVVWPSANRALELLRGSKVNSKEVDLSALTNSQVRRKRSVEQALNDTTDKNMYLSSNLPTPKNQVDMRTPYTHQFDTQAPYAIHDPEMRAHTTASSTNVSYLPPQSPFNRWTSGEGDQLGYVNSLSTSVLPQLYSTGLDGRSSGGQRYSSQQQVNARANPQNRYPQYWNDFSTFPQLGTAYGGYPAGESAATPPVHQPQPSPQIYLNEPYNLYNQDPSDH